MQTWTSVPRDYTAEHARDYVDGCLASWEKADGGRVFAIEDKNQPGRYCGDVNLRPLSTQVASIGYSLHPDARGKGLMIDAVKTACRWWFDQGGSVIRWEAWLDNVASVAVASSLGFEFDPGTRRYAAFDHAGRGRESYTATLHRDQFARNDSSERDAENPARNLHKAPVIQGDNITLRPWQPHDVEALEEPQHPAHFMPPGAMPTPETFSRWLGRRQIAALRGDGVFWAISDTATGKALGCVQLFRFSGTRAEIGYWILPANVGRGLAAQAVKLLAQWALKPQEDGGLGLERLTGRYVSDNYASGRVLAAVGFTPAGFTPDEGTNELGRRYGLYTMERSAATSQAVSVVAGTRADWRRLRALRIRALTENPTSFGATLADALAADNSHWIEDSQKPGHFIALLDGADIGQAKTTCDAQRPDHWHISRMWVDPSARGAGAGRAILETAENYITQAGGKQIQLCVYGDQVAAKQLYLSRGYQEVSTCSETNQLNLVKHLT